LCKLVVDFFQLPDCMVQLAERVIKAVGCWWLVFVALIHHLVVIIIVDNGRGHEVCGAGVRKGVCCQMSKFVVKGVPFLKKGGVVITLNLVEIAVIIVGLQVDDCIGSSFLKDTGRDCT